MTVLEINNRYEKGGTERVFRDTVSALEAIPSFKVFLSYGGQEGERPPDVKLECVDPRRKRDAFRYIFSASNFRKIFWFLLKNHVDIVHVHGFYADLSPSIILSIRLAKTIRRFKVVQTLHDYSLACPNGPAFNYRTQTVCTKCFGRRFKWRILSDNCEYRGRIYSVMKFLRSLLGRAVFAHDRVVDQFVTPSRFATDLLERDIPPRRRRDGTQESRARVQTVSNPVDHSQWEAAGLGAEKRDEVIYFGRLTPEKGLRVLCEASERLPEGTELSFVGEGPYRSLIEEYYETHPNAQLKVNYVSFLRTPELQQRVATAKVAVVSSLWYETFGLSVYEAVLARVIPVVSDIGAFPDAIDRLGVGMVFHQGSAQELSDKILHALESYSDHLEALSAASRRIKEELSLAEYGKRLTSLFSEVLRN